MNRSSLARLIASGAATFVAIAVPAAAFAVTLSDPRNSRTGVPLEPNLITLLLPVFGIVSAIVMVFVDRRIRAGHASNRISEITAGPARTVR